jgi:hypothetical protein
LSKKSSQNNFFQEDEKTPAVLETPGFRNNLRAEPSNPSIDPLSPREEIEEVE